MFSYSYGLSDKPYGIWPWTLSVFRCHEIRSWFDNFDDVSCSWFDFPKLWHFLNMMDMSINLERNQKVPYDFDYLIFAELVSINC